MSLVFNTNLPRNGIDWRNFSLNGFVDAINQNIGKITSNTAILVSSPFSNTSSVSTTLLSDGNVLCIGSEGTYRFNPVSLEFLKLPNSVPFSDKLLLLNDGNVLCHRFSSVFIINPLDGSYVRNNPLTITAPTQQQFQIITITSGPQTIAVSLESGTGGRYITGMIVQVFSSISFTGIITSATSNSITVSKTSQTETGTVSDFWSIATIGQTSTALDTFGSSVLNFQKLPESIYVLTNSSFDRDVYIDHLNWTIRFSSKSLNTGYKSSSIYNSAQMIFPKTTFTKIINTRTISHYAITDGTNFELITNTGSTAFSNLLNDSIGIFCFLPQINIPLGSSAQGQILLSIVGGVSKIWNLNGNTISISTMSGSAPDEYTEPVQLLDGRIFLKPFPSNTNPSSFLIYGGGGGFNPNVTLSPYFNKWN